jgi:hypothetical protein
MTLTGCGAPQQYNEDRAIGALQTIRDAEERFRLKNGRYGTQKDLATSNWGIPAAKENGYEFKLDATSDSYFAVASPIQYKEQSLSLYVDQSGIIRGMFKNGAEATAKDPALRGPGINPNLRPSP